jgi:purine nucleosidase
VNTTRLSTLLAGLLLVASVASAAERTRLVLDTDANNELDDQHAIAYLLFSGRAFDVEGLTVNRTKSGGDIDQQYEEAVRVERLCGLGSRVPVRRGASGSFTEIQPTLGRAGHDGADAVDFIIERARAHDGRRLVVLAVGKLTNVALALAKAPDITSKIRLVWLGSNYPEPGEYNQENDEPAVNYVLDSHVDFEVALVRYGKPSGTDAVRATLDDVRRILPGKGPLVTPPVPGRHGGTFSHFGDYSIDLFEHIELSGTPPSRALFDMAAAAIVKDARWATPVRTPAPILKDGKWVERPGNTRQVVWWQNFDRAAIMKDFYDTMSSWTLVGSDGGPGAPPLR